MQHVLSPCSILKPLSFKVLLLAFILSLVSPLSRAQQSASISSNWGHYVTTGITTGKAAVMLNVRVSGSNSFWSGTFLIHGMLNSYTSNTNTWNTVSLLDYAVYNTSQNSVTLSLMSNSSGSEFGGIEAVINTSEIESGGPNTIEVRATGISSSLALTNYSGIPFTHVLSSSVNQFVWNSRNFSPSGYMPVTGGTVNGGLLLRNNNEIVPGYGLSLSQEGDLRSLISAAGRNLKIQQGWDKTLTLGNPQDQQYGGKVLIPGADVGIGTDDPQGYKLAVNGKIRSKEIKVENTNWPDYVFAPKYQLSDLKVTEQFIKENNHLPEIPSASEVEKDGVNLGEMNAKLLKKVEELTLYMIEQSKISDQQAKKLAEAEQKIEQLTNIVQQLPKK